MRFYRGRAMKHFVNNELRKQNSNASQKNTIPNKDENYVAPGCLYYIFIFIITFVVSAFFCVWFFDNIESLLLTSLVISVMVCIVALVAEHEQKEKFKKNIYDKKYYELIEEHNAWEKAKAEYEAEWEKQKSEYEKMIKDGIDYYPHLAAIKADLLTIHFDNTISYLENKSHPAISAAENIRYFKKETQEAIEKCTNMKYKFQYLILLYPELKELLSKKINPSDIQRLTSAIEALQAENDLLKKQFEEIEGGINNESVDSDSTDKVAENMLLISRLQDDNRELASSNDFLKKELKKLNDKVSHLTAENKLLSSYEKEYKKSQSNFSIAVLPGLEKYLHIEDFAPSVFSSAYTEPSTIYKDLPFTEPENIESVPHPDYWPSYRTLTPEQRGVYLKMLLNPFALKYYIGYIFILYYGLEKRMLEENYEDVIKFVFKLQDYYDSLSFQKYSTTAIVSVCLKNQNYALLDIQLSGYNQKQLDALDIDLLIMAKYVTKQKFNAIDLFTYRRTFGIPYNKIIKEHQSEFLLCLSNKMIEYLGTDEFLVDELLEHSNEVQNKNIVVFANQSLNKTIIVPQISKHPIFYHKCNKCLLDALQDFYKMRGTQI